MTATAPVIELAEQELEADRRHVRPVRLVRAARVLDAALAAVRKGAAGARECGRC